MKSLLDEFYSDVLARKQRQRKSSASCASFDKKTPLIDRVKGDRYTSVTFFI